MNKKQIEDIYSLSPMQQGMLFDTLYLSGTGIYIERNGMHISGPLDIPAFKQAWQNVIARYAALRTLFLSENRDEPLQVVRWNVELPWRELDWQDIPTEERQTNLAQLLDNERFTEFDLKQAPLLRLILIRLAKDEYYFVFVFHHLIMDRWSLGLILNDLFVFYQAIKQGKQAHLPHTRPFGDYISWIKEQDTAQLEQFWRKTLAGFTAPTSLTIETTHRPTVGEAHYGQVETWLSAEALQNLKAWAKQHRLTLNSVVQGVWSLLLSFYSRETDILFGVTIAGRPDDFPGVETMVGLFINTLPVRVQVDPTLPLLDWLLTMQAQMMTLQQYVYTPLVDVQNWSDVPGGTPLFESIIVFENIPVSSLPPETGLQIKGSDIVVQGQMAYPLTVTINPNAHGKMWLQLTYEQERFDREAIQQLTEQLKTLLINLPVQAQQKIANLSYLGEQEKAHLLHNLSNAKSKTAVSHLIHRLIEEQAKQTPSALALTTTKQVQRPSFFLETVAEMPEAFLTYEELNGRANQLARHLIHAGVGPEKVVALYRERSANTLVCMLAILKAGGVFLPIDPQTPSQRLIHILNDANPVVMLTDKPEDHWPGIQTICPEHESKTIASYAADNLNIPLSVDNSAYLIYTSGTTGLPKGVMVPHRALTNHAQFIRRHYDLSSADRVLQFAAVTFDVALEEIFPTWLAGASLLLRPLDVPPLDEFTQLIENEQLTVVNIPSPYWHEWVAELSRASFVNLSSSLRLVVVGSDKTLSDKLQQWHELVPSPIKVINAYGPTESAITTTLFTVHKETEIPPVVPLGCPIDNVEAYVLSENGRLAPIGTVGELYLGGQGLAHGYLNQARQTATAFVPHPFSEVPGERLYRTGDLVRWLPDGNLAFVGRADYQVKIRGFRIELEEIEASLSRYSGVRQTVVVADETNQRLIAYILHDDLTLTARQLQTWAQTVLPAYMIPTAWVFVDTFPLTTSGKIDRQALPEPVLGDDTNSFVAPRSPDEQTIANIWGEVLALKRVGIHDNFFQLGGHSLRATQIVSRIRQQLGWDIPVRALFELPTIAEFSAHYSPNPIMEEDTTLSDLMDEIEGLSADELDDLEALLELTESDAS